MMSSQTLLCSLSNFTHIQYGHGSLFRKDAPRRPDSSEPCSSFHVESSDVKCETFSMFNLLSLRHLLTPTLLYLLLILSTTNRLKCCVFVDHQQSLPPRALSYPHLPYSTVLTSNPGQGKTQKDDPEMPVAGSRTATHLILRNVRLVQSAPCL